MHALPLPWNRRSVPHAVLDISRGCNIRCRACYNTSRSIQTKPLHQIEEELRLLLARRSLHCITIAGGEPSLHPQLPEIVRLVRSHRLHAVVLTNGYELPDPLLRSLKAADVSMLMTHIDSGQQRPDLPSDATADQVNGLRRSVASNIESHGIAVGMQATGYADQLDDIAAAVHFVLTSPSVDYLLVTNCTAVSSFAQLQGDLDSGLTCTPPNRDALCHQDLSIHDTDALLQRRFALSPFAQLPSSDDPGDPRWLSYVTGTAFLPNGERLTQCIRSSWTERLALRLIYRISGRYPFLQRESPTGFRLQLLCNALSGGRFPQTLTLLLHSLRPGTHLRAKHLLFQSGPRRRPDGRISHCFACPDATIRNGRLVPVCLSDQICEGQCRSC